MAESCTSVSGYLVLYRFRFYHCSTNYRTCAMCVVGYMCDWLHVWSTTCVVVTCVVSYMCGRLHVWLATCVVSYMCGQLHVWSATCVVGYMCGQLHVWSATYIYITNALLITRSMVNFPSILTEKIQKS